MVRALLVVTLELAEIMGKLKVPLVLPLQEDAFSCVPRCIKMIFMYISNCLEGCAPNLDIDDIAKIIETRDDGTLFEKVRNLNTNLDVLRIIPSLEFDVDVKMRSLPEIEEEVEKAHRPVIALIGSSDPIRRWVHAIVVTGLDKEKHLIYYNDPVFGEVEEDIGMFMSKWEGADRFLIKVKIGMREQKLLDEYFQKKEKGE